MRRDSGSSASASYSVVTFAGPDPITAVSVELPHGFKVRSDLRRPRPECDWQTTKPCTADLAQLYDGAEADYANGRCWADLVQQSNAAEVNGGHYPVGVMSISCSEPMPRP